MVAKEPTKQVRSEIEAMKEPHRAERGFRGVFLVELYTYKFRQGYQGRGQKNFRALGMKVVGLRIAMLRR